MGIILLFVLFFAFLLVGIPIAFATLLSAVVMLLGVLHADPLLIALRMVGTLDRWVWLAIPLYIMLGNCLNVTGITQRLIALCNAFIGHLPGGLSHISVGTNMLLSGISGSMGADAAAVGSLLGPSMKKAGYPAGYVAGIVAFGAMMGPLIPPSVLFIILAGTADISVLRLWLGGAIPGVLVGIVLFAAGYVLAKRRGYPKGERATWRERMNSVVPALPALVIPIVIIGGMRIGLFTATESGAVGVVYALLLGFLVFRETKLSALLDYSFQTIKTSAGVFFILAAAAVFQWVLTTLQAGPLMVKMIPQTISPLSFLFTMNIIFLILGCVMESTPLILIFIPLLMPMVTSIGVDPIHFGVMFVLNLLIGQMTPPVGITMFIMLGLTGASVGEFVKESWPLFVCALFLLVMITVFPQISVFLPNLVMGVAK